MRYAEFENVIYRGDDTPRSPMLEKMANGAWVGAGDSAYDATAMGTPMTEEEAKEFAGDEWPAEDTAGMPAQTTAT